MMGNTNDALYSVNTSDGSAMRIGMASQFGQSEEEPRGLAAIGETLYMVGNTNDALYRVNTTTGEAERIDSTVTQFGVSEQGPAGFGPPLVIPSTWWASLLVFCTAWTRPLAWLCQWTGPPPAGFGIGLLVPRGLAAIGETLYMVGANSDPAAFLYTVNSSTGVASRVGSATDFGVSEDGAYGLAAIGDTLYMVGTRNDCFVQGGYL